MKHIIAIAIALAFTSPAMAFDWRNPPAAEWEEEYDTKQEVKEDLQENKSAIGAWFDRVKNWKNERINDNKEDIKQAKQAKKAGELTKEEFAEIKAERKEANRSLREARKESKRSAKQANKAAKAEAKERSRGL